MLQSALARLCLSGGAFGQIEPGGTKRPRAPATCPHSWALGRAIVEYSFRTFSIYHVSYNTVGYNTCNENSMQEAPRRIKWVNLFKPGIKPGT